jgi:hypothetical protein
VSRQVVRLRPRSPSGAESVRLHLKKPLPVSALRVSRDHDLEKQIYELSVALNEFSVDRRQVARLVLANSMLALWRSPTFYGDETLKVGGKEVFRNSGCGCGPIAICTRRCNGRLGVRGNGPDGDSIVRRIWLVLCDGRRDAGRIVIR